MSYPTRIYYTDEQKKEMWDRHYSWSGIDRYETLFGAYCVNGSDVQSGNTAWCD